MRSLPISHGANTCKGRSVWVRTSVFQRIEILGRRETGFAHSIESSRFMNSFRSVERCARSWPRNMETLADLGGMYIVTAQHTPQHGNGNREKELADLDLSLQLGHSVAQRLVCYLGPGTR